MNNVLDLIDISDIYYSEELLYNCCKTIFIDYDLLFKNKNIIEEKFKSFKNINLKKILKLLCKNIDFNIFFENEDKNKNIHKAILLNIINSLN